MNRTIEDIYQDIRIHPESDQLRLEYANVCAAADPEWAWFIRESLKSSTTPHGYAMPGIPRALEDRLLAPLRQLGASGRFDRGFVDILLVDPYLFLKRGRDLLELAPIIEVSFSTADYEKRRRVFPMSELMACEELKRVRHLTFWKGEYFDLRSLETIIASTNLDNLLELQTPWAHYEETNPWSSDDFKSVWPQLFACDAFRRSVRWDFGSTRHPKPGDRTIVTNDRDDNYVWEDVTYVPMPAEDRLIEENYGYIPQLHAVNWDKTVLDALRGKFPAFPVGAAPTEAMYAVPAPHRRDEQIHRENW